MSTVIGLRAGVKWQQWQSRLCRQWQDVCDLIQLVLCILQRVAPLCRRHGLLLQLTDVIMLRCKTFLAFWKTRIGGSIRLPQQCIIIHASDFHDAIQTGQRSLTGTVRRLLGWTRGQAIGGLTAHTALSNIEPEGWLTEHTAHIRAIKGRRGSHLRHGQLRGEDLMQPGQLIKLVSTESER